MSCNLTSLPKRRPPVRQSLADTYFINKISKESGIPFHTVRLVINAFRHILTSSLSAGEAVALEGLGKFYFRFRKGRTNPVTGEVSKDHLCIKFKPSHILVSRVHQIDPKTVLHAEHWKRYKDLKEAVGFYKKVDAINKAKAQEPVVAVATQG